MLQLKYPSLKNLPRNVTNDEFISWYRVLLLYRMAFVVTWLFDVLKAIINQAA